MSDCRLPPPCSWSPWLFWDVTWRSLAGRHRRFGTHIFPIFKVQSIQQEEELTACTLETGERGFPEKSVTSYQPKLHNIPEERRFYVGEFCVGIKERLRGKYFGNISQRFVKLILLSTFKIQINPYRILQFQFRCYSRMTFLYLFHNLL
jgi:hypothetical protein